ncbi:MAG: helix-turn-helix transcriptional regulator [Pseudomonadota bacterium]
MAGLSKSTIWRMEQRGAFPSRIRLSPNRVGWWSSDVERWLECRRSDLPWTGR